METPKFEKKSEKGDGARSAGLQHKTGAASWTGSIKDLATVRRGVAYTNGGPHEFGVSGHGKMWSWQPFALANIFLAENDLQRQIFAIAMI